MAEVMRKNNRWFGLLEHLSALIGTLMVLTGLILSVIGYRMVIDLSESNIREKITGLASTIKNGVIQMVRQPVHPTLDMLVRSALAECDTLEERLTHLSALTALLNTYPIISGAMVGYANGDYFMVRRLVGEEELQAFKAPPDSVFLVINILRDVESVQFEYLFYDENSTLILRRPGGEVTPDYDPRTRPWFQAAMETNRRVDLHPMLLSSGWPALFFAEKSHYGNAVVGLQIALPQVSEILRRELPTPNSHLALLRPDGTLIASTQGMLIIDDGRPRVRTMEDLHPILNRAAWAYLAGQHEGGISIDDGREQWEVSLEEYRSNGIVKDAMLLAIPQDDLLTRGMNFLRYAFLGLAGILLFSLPVVWLAARRISIPLRIMAERAWNFAEPSGEKKETVSSRVKEIADLMHGIDHMQQHQKKILSLIGMIGSDRDFQGALKHMLKEIASMARVDGCILVTMDGTKNLFDKGWFYWDGGEVQHTVVSGITQRERYSTYRALDGKCTVLDRVTRGDSRAQIEPVIPGFDDPAVEWLDVVSLPLYDRMGESLGGITLLKRGRPGSTAFSSGQVAFVETLVATTAIVLETQELIKGQFDLRDALIHILAGAIDAKSPYTGGHCARVPVIFQMLLEAACNEQGGAFKDFSLDEDGWEEARLAGWLHDCGKVTTPEYVMDKATKLETLYDRIHEIRTRFEVLKRDAQIAYLHALLDGADPASAQQTLEKELRALDEDFAFVASCNAGSEYMDDEAQARLAAIGQRTWLRTLDKRLGVSRDELARMNCVPASDLPAQETLLMDTPEHVIARGEKDQIDPKNVRRFKLNPPEALYNRGELYNLSIRRGTLTEEERYKINDHITRTILMLEAMPLPRHLRNMPEIVGAHHETMDGRGYPRGLTREEMSWPARMMAVADIFEALTAWDRPYKSSKTLKETLEIMEGFKKRNHIDSDVYDLFIKSGVPQRYAKDYLKPEQNDL